MGRTRYSWRSRRYRLPVTIGSSVQNDIPIKNPQLDGVQCKVHTKGNEILVTNLNCDIPILINQTVSTAESVTLSHGDILTFPEDHNFSLKIDYLYAWPYGQL